MHTLTEKQIKRIELDAEKRLSENTKWLSLSDEYRRGAITGYAAHTIRATVLEYGIVSAMENFILGNKELVYKELQNALATYNS